MPMLRQRMTTSGFAKTWSERKKSPPFGGTVAPGYFILALAPGLLKKVWYLQGARLGMNYGINRLRFPAPLRVGKRVRLRASVRRVHSRSKRTGGDFGPVI